MKKLLGILGALGLTATASSTVIACGDEMHPGFIENADDEVNDVKKMPEYNKEGLWLMGTRFVFETKDMNDAHLRIFFNRDLTDLAVNNDAELAKSVKIYKGTETKPESIVKEVNLNKSDVYISGSWINIKFSGDYIRSTFIKGDTFTVSIDQSFFPNGGYKNTAFTGETDDEHISFGPSFKIPGPDNI